MFSWLKKHFIPHEGNEHRPHILRNESIRNIVAIVIFLEIFTFLIPIISHLNMTGGMAAVLPGVLSMLTNEKRQAQNLQILTVSPILNQAAEMKANDMATKGYFAHTSPEGKTPWHWLQLAGYNYQYAGENLAINFNDSIDVTNAWMASPTHKTNIVKENYTEIGTGIANGIYQGRQTIFVAQVYANPAPKTVVEPKPTKAKAEVKKTAETSKIAIQNVLGAETSVPIQSPTFWQKMLTSPRNSMNVILFTVFGIIIIALVIYIFAKQYHLKLITNGLIILAILGAIFLANYYLSHHNMIITQSLDYANESQ